jgi:hypothetical protein
MDILADALRGENKMAKIAMLFNKRLGEYFYVKSTYDEIANCKGCFTPDGFEGCRLSMQTNEYIFGLLCSGRAVIVDEAEYDK